MKQILIEAFENNNVNFDSEKLNKAYDFASSIYGQKRRHTGELYLEHTVFVAKDIIELRLDENSVYAALLHEILRNGGNLEEIETALGKEVSELIEGIDRLSLLNYSSSYKLNEDVLRKMFMAIAKDIRVVIIKLIDRLYNMRRAGNMDEDFRKIKAKETLEIYSPISHRLGMSSVKSELEDISFRILHSDKYQEIKEKIDAKKSIREAFIKSRIDEIKQALSKEGILCEVYGRPKHFYSIYKKMKDKNYDIEDIFDLLAIRIIVDSVKDCYSTLGIVHEMYKPMPGRFKDYIAVPKTNNYQSLHTTVFGDSSMAFEVQIRTWDMQKHAEYGVAAHFMYKEKNKSKSLDDTEQKIMWLRQSLELKKDILENQNSINMFKTQLFGEEVFVFTPKGEIKALPKGSSVIDFAYGIHQNVAEKMIGAKINGKIVPISTKLKNTDVINIITSVNSKGPSLDWLKYVKTASARNKITSYIKRKDSTINVARGKEILEKEIKKYKIPKVEAFSTEILEEVRKSLKCKSEESIFENIGFGTISPIKVANKILDIYNSKNNLQVSGDIDNFVKKIKCTSKDIVEVDGIDNCLIRFARCCNPIFGDEIIGYVTYGNGVSIHRNDCPNLKSLDLINRKIGVRWKDKVKANFCGNLKILSNYRENVTTDIVKVIGDMKKDLISLNIINKDKKELNISLSVKVESNEELNKVIRNLKKVDSIYEVKRAR